MPVVKCVDCQAEMSETAAVCPKCGRPTERNVRGCLLALFAATLACAAVAFLSYELKQLLH
jgi:predicted amidophosphoribosyltransferase